jgi:hypothetical protein
VLDAGDRSGVTRITISRVAYSDVTKHGMQPGAENAWGLLLGSRDGGRISVALPVGARHYMALEHLDSLELQHAWRAAEELAGSYGLEPCGCYYSDFGSETDYRWEITRGVLARFEWLSRGALVLIRDLFGGETFWNGDLIVRTPAGWSQGKLAIGPRREGRGAVNPRRLRADWRLRTLGDQAR